MINSGTKTPQLASCVLHYNNSDSRDGLLGTLNDISTYSSDAAGIGLCMSNIRSKESRISSSGGYAGGLLKYLKIVNESLRYFNQQGRRPGSAAIYIEPWHKDIIDLLEIKKNTGAEELRARDLFTALWIPDNFMRAVESNGDWYLFCPNDILKAGIKPLQECYGQEYEDNYNKAVALGLGKKVSAQTIWSKIVESQIETGVPYLSSKDNANNKTNHQNIGVVKQSNLCNEIYQYTDEDTTAICTLSSMVLKNFIKDGKFDLRLLHDETRKVVRALNKVVDINNYSTEQGRKGGMEQRAIAIGTQGLADVFYLLDYIFTSEEARQLNKDIFETIYYAAISESNELCRTGQYQPY
jgi:ribonucleoside-diphosphate reductase alpha chain